MLPKVLVGCPTYDGMEYCLEKYASVVKKLNYPNYDILLVDNSKDNKYAEKIKKLGIKVVHVERTGDPKEVVAASRNILRRKVLDGDYDFLLSLEQDVIPPRTIIQKLLSNNKKIVSGIYYKPFNLKIINQGKILTKKQIRPILYLPIPGETTKMHFATSKDVEGEKLLKARMTGLGAILIHRSVLEKIEFRVEKDLKTFDDACFAEDVIKNKFNLYADTSIKCKHLVLGKN